MNTMDEMGLLKILIERSSYINTYWNFYIIVATSVVGIIASGKIQVTTTIRLFFACSFLLFAVSNLLAITELNEQRKVLVSSISGELSVLAQTFKPSKSYVYTVFHMALNLIVLLCISTIGKNRKQPVSDVKQSL